MQCELAQDQYSEYIEETLTPAMRHVFEQHLATCEPCTENVFQLRGVYSLLNDGLPMVEVPAGFRAGVLNAIREQPRSTSVWQRVAGIFGPRVSTSGAGSLRAPVWSSAVAAFTVVVVGGFWLTRHTSPDSTVPSTITQSSLVPWEAVPVDVQNGSGILQGVRSYSSADGKNYHVFGLHLPAGMSTTNASAYIVQDSAALFNDSLLGDADKAPAAFTGAVAANTSVQVPVTLTDDVPADTSMMTLVTWSDQAGKHKELCILPISKSSNTLSIAVGEPMYQALQTIAVQYQQPIIVNDDAENLLNTPVSQAPSASDTSINQTLADVLLPDQMEFQQQKDGAYVVDAS